VWTRLGAHALDTSDPLMRRGASMPRRLPSACAAPACGGRDEGHPRHEYERRDHPATLVFVVSGDLLPREVRRRMRRRSRVFSALLHVIGIEVIVIDPSTGSAPRLSLGVKIS
jgi:hypothetical protein